MKNKALILTLLGIMLLSTGIFYFVDDNAINTQQPIESNDDILSVTGKVNGYTTHQDFIYIRIDYKTYTVKGLTESQVKDFTGCKVEMTLRNIEKDKYDLVNIIKLSNDEIKPEVMTEDNKSKIEFVDWFEENNPIIYKLIYNRYVRKNNVQ